MMEEIGVERIARPDKVVMVVDHTTSAAKGTSYAINHREMRDYAARHGAHFFGPGSGLRHQIMLEQGFARPGLLVFSDESNIANLGVVGALNVSVSTEVVVTTITDENWMMVPSSALIELTGALPFGVQARDLAQVLIRDFSATGELTQTCVEFAGPAIGGLSLDERQTLLATIYHASADTALMPVDDKALAFVDSVAQGREYHCFASDADASYVARRRYDLSALTPMVTLPPDLSTLASVADVGSVRIDQAAIGSCANNRIDDLRAAAAVLKGRSVDAGVTLYITPGSRAIYAQAAREGLLEVFAQAGATVLAPGCTTCWGYEGVLNAGETSVSTHQTNFPGRNGSMDAQAYLAGPYVVAASAIAGRLVDPRPMLAEAAR